MDAKVKELYDELRESARHRAPEFDSNADVLRSKVDAHAWDMSSYIDRYVTSMDPRTLRDSPEARKHLWAAHEEHRDMYVSLAVLSELQGDNALKDRYMDVARQLQKVLEHEGS